MERRLLQVLVALTVLTSGAILAVSLVGATRSAKALSESLIDNTIAQTRSELSGFFEGVDEALHTARRWGEEGMLDVGDTQAMNRLFMPVLEQHGAITSMMVASADGRHEYMLLQLPDGWRNRLVDGEHARFLVLDRDGNLVEEDTVDRPYDPRSRPWFQAAMSAADGEVGWTEPYTFFTTRDPGITASTRFRIPGEEQEWVVAFDVLLLDISHFTTALEAGTHGQVAVLTSTGNVVGLPRDARFEGEDAIRAHVLSPLDALEDAALSAAVEAHQGAAADARPFRFDVDGANYWGATRLFALPPDRDLTIVALVPEADFTGRVTELRNRILAIAAIAVILAIGLGVVLDRAVQRRLQAARQQARRVGPYTLEQELGRGGMGTVYRARHALLRRPTAVKLMLEEQQDEVSKRRFEKEVQHTSRLTHPNTIAIYDFGRTKDGTFYYAMEYLEGITLEQLVERAGPVPPGRAIHILRQICGSLAEAHDAGLIHRDIKPANIMLCARGGLYDWVKVLDFGLVKRTGDASETGVRVTGDGRITGTPHYIAPEALVAPDTVDARIDLYAVGAVGYFLLTGGTVFTGRTVMETLTHHLSVAPPPPSSRTDRPIPKDLEEVILACLEKDPSARPASARALRHRLDACGEAHSWTQEDARGWWEAHVGLFSMPPEPGAEGIAVEPTQLAIEVGTR